MELYSLILFAHVVCALGMSAAVAMLFGCEGMARRTTTPSGLRAILETEEHVAEFMKGMALVLGTSGLYMAYEHWSVSAPWVIVALIVFVYLASTGPLVFGRRMRTAVHEAERAGSINSEVRRLLDDPVIAMMGRMRVAFLALFVFLMTTKPGFVGTIVAFGMAVALGALSGTLLARKSSNTLEAV